MKTSFTDKEREILEPAIRGYFQLANKQCPENFSMTRIGSYSLLVKNKTSFVEYLDFYHADFSGWLVLITDTPLGYRVYTYGEQLCFKLKADGIVRISGSDTYHDDYDPSPCGFVAPDFFCIDKVLIHKSALRHSHLKMYFARSDSEVVYSIFKFHDPQ